MNQKGFWKEIYESTSRHYNWMFVVSALILTFIMTLNYSVVIEYEGYWATEYEVNIAYAVVSMLFMIPVYLYLTYKKKFVMQNMEKISPVKGWMAFIISLLVGRQLLVDTQANYTHVIDKLAEAFPAVAWENGMEIGYFKVVPVLCILTIFSCFVFCLSVINLLYFFYCEIVIRSDRTERIYFGISLLQCVMMIGFFYIRTNLQWSSLDRIYQTDSAFVCNNYYPVFSLGWSFDWDIGNGGIRHPLMTLYTYPLYLLASALADLFFFLPYVQVVWYAVIQSVLMILTVIMLKRLIKSNWIYLIFNLSFPFLFFTINVEKYQLSTFFLVMYVYSIVRGEGKRDEIKKYSLIAATGTMATSALLGVFYSKGKTVKEKLKGYAGLLAEFFVILIGTGRIHYIWNFAYLLDQNFVMFNGKSSGASLKAALAGIGSRMFMATGVLTAGLGGITIANGDLEVIPMFAKRLCSFFNLLASCFVPVPYHTTENQFGISIFFWKSLQSELSVFGILVFAILIAVFVKHRKEKFVQMCSAWILWAFVQFGVIGFSASCSPLFSLYFGWAVIPMVLIGMKDVLRKPMHQLLGYGTLAFLMLYTNYVHLNDLYVFMLAG